MKHINLPLAFLLALLLACSACSEDPATPPDDDPSVAQGTLTPAGPDFEIEIEFASSPDSLFRGPFLLRGQNLHYSDLLGALIVEFTITNNGEVTYPDPVRINFFRLIPETTMILNSPDDSPIFTFEFANDDLWWTPGEESFPLQVMFSAELGQSVGFNAHVMLQPEEPGLHIAGRVWLDANGDGMQDPDEPGLGWIPLVVDDGGPQEIFRQVFTDTGGYFRFQDLHSGTWEVRVLTIPDGLMSTTPANMHVLLATPMGGSGGFEQADFGFMEFHPPPD